MIGGQDSGEVYLAFDKVADSCFGHDGNGHGVHDLLDHFGITHPCNTTLDSDVCGDSLESHDG